MRLRVVCGRGDTIASFSPTSRLSSVDLPEFGRPIKATKPARLAPPCLPPGSVAPAEPALGVDSSGMEQAFPETVGDSPGSGFEDGALATVHEVGFDGVAVVVADDVQDPVRDEQ